MRYTTEVEVKDALGLPDWRYLNKSHIRQLLSMMSDMEPEVALNILGQLPDITAFARVALDDVAKAHAAAQVSNSRSMEMVHEIQMERLAILKNELDKDLSEEERLHVLKEIRDVHASALLKDTENKEFQSEQLDKRVFSIVVAVTIVGTFVFAAATAGSKRPVFKT